MNEKELKKKMLDSDININEISEELGITRASFYNKRKGITKFKKVEIFLLKSLLKLSDEEVITIFGKGRWIEWVYWKAEKNY